MRLTVDQNDIDFGKDLRANLPSTQIYLDGIEQKLVITADEDEGYVLKYKGKSKDGRLILDSDGNLSNEVLRGKVEIKFGDEE